MTNQHHVKAARTGAGVYSFPLHPLASAPMRIGALKNQNYHVSPKSLNIMNGFMA